MITEDKLREKMRQAERLFKERLHVPRTSSAGSNWHVDKSGSIKLQCKECNMSTSVNALGKLERTAHRTVCKGPGLQ